MKWAIRLTVMCVVLFLLVNFRWVHAGMALSLSDSACDPNLVSQAHEQLATLYPNPQSQPLLGCLDEPVLGQGHIIGTANFAPGLPSIILLNHQGQQLDVMAHEWAHAEFVHRVGIIHRELNVPTWLDEGLAMQVDLRTGYNLDAMVELLSNPDLLQPDVNKLSSLASFSKPGAQGRLHYAFSRCVVGQLIAAGAFSVTNLTTLPTPLEIENAQTVCLAAARVDDAS